MSVNNPNIFDYVIFVIQKALNVKPDVASLVWCNVTLRKVMSTGYRELNLERNQCSKDVQQLWFCFQLAPLRHFFTALSSFWFINGWFQS